MCSFSGFAVAKLDIARSVVPIASRSTRALRSFAMSQRLKRLLRNPAFLVALVAFLAALLVQSGELGSIDTTRRLQTTHSFWTSAPPVAPDDYPDFVIPRSNRPISPSNATPQPLPIPPPALPAPH